MRRTATRTLVLAMLLLIALVTLAPRNCPGCGFEKLNTKFDEQSFVMEIVALRVDCENGTVRGRAEFTATDPDGLFRAATFGMRFGGTLDRETGEIVGKGQFRLKDDPDDVIINAFGSMRFDGVRTGSNTIVIQGTGRIVHVSDEPEQT